MNFIRPEARAAIWRWRELLAAGVIAVVGASWAAGPGGLLGWVGWALIVAAAALAIIGIQRARFRTGTGGPGVVQVDEGQIAYFGPLTGGAVSTSELERLVLDPTSQPTHWLLHQPGQPILHVPINAEGVDALFDVFSVLPGFNTEKMLSTLRKPGGHPVVIWERNPMRPAGLLHS